MRLTAGLVAGHRFHTTITGDASLSRRPMRRVIDPLTAMGARIVSHDGRAPIEIDGADLTAIPWTPEVPSAQIKSAILLAGLHPRGVTTVHEPLHARPHGADVSRFRHRGVGAGTRPIRGGRPGRRGADGHAADSRRSVVSGVWAAAASALQGSSVRLTDVCLNPYWIGFVAALRRMGAVIDMEDEREVAGETVGRCGVHGDHRETVITEAEAPALIDELPVLAARAALGGRLTVTGASELRVKESDRITALVNGFRALGVDASELPDGFVIDGARQPRAARWMPRKTIVS
jgi:3-phosphoshikimate 1-carboxyvinyltransferase